MKIAVYKDTFANNRGADVAVKNLAAGLSERGHDVSLFDKSLFEAKIHGDYDVIISTGTNEIQDLAKVDGLPPVVQQFHTDPAYPFRHWIKRWRRNRAIKKALRRAAAFQVLSRSHVGSLQRLLGGVPDGRISVIGNWSAFEDRAPPGAYRAGKVVICPGAINKDKNQALLVDAFAEIAPEFPDWEIHIYGKGKAKDESALARRIRSHNLERRVLLKGYADLTEAYSECSFVAFPSKTEGFGMVILDAALFAKPTLMVHDWIGTASVTGGILTTPKVSAFADGLRRLLGDEAFCRRLGEEARVYCQNRFSRDGVLDEWERLLSQVAKAGV